MILADLAICYLIVGMLISMGIAVRYPNNVNTKIAGYQFKSRFGAKIAGYFLILLIWPAVLLFGKFE